MSHLPLLAMFIDVTAILETLLSLLPCRKQDVGDDDDGTISVEPRPAPAAESRFDPVYVGRVQPGLTR